MSFLLTGKRTGNSQIDECRKELLESVEGVKKVYFSLAAAWAYAWLLLAVAF